MGLRAVRTAAGLGVLFGAAWLVGKRYDIATIPAAVPAGTLRDACVAAALLFSTFAMMLAWRATSHASASRKELRRLSLSVGTALRDATPAAGRSRAAGERLPPGAVSTSGTGPADNVVLHPAALSPRKAAAASAGHDLEKAVAALLEGGQFAISLQPIVSVSAGTATGFDVFASVHAAAGRRVDIRRLQVGPARLRAAFEGALLDAATDMARRRQDRGAARLPLHVAVSRALLDDREAFDRALERLSAYSRAARQIVLSIPVELVGGREPDGRLVDLAGRGLRICVEGSGASMPDAAALETLGAATVRMDADRLAAPGRSSTLPEDIPHGLAVIAADVATEAQALRLLDMGIDLMSGSHFCAPEPQSALS
jgi:EAL domain-containing protein (putative c-di-GMP-specific phosphodiesterase class I)